MTGIIRTKGAASPVTWQSLCLCVTSRSKDQANSLSMLKEGKEEAGVGWGEYIQNSVFDFCNKWQRGGLGEAPVLLGPSLMLAYSYGYQKAGW